MFNIVQKRHWYFLFSSLIIVPGLIAMIISLVTTGSLIKLGIDFTGGVLWEMRFEQTVLPAPVREVFSQYGLDSTVQTSMDDQAVLVRTREIDDATRAEISDELVARLGAYEELRYEFVGPAVGAEVTRAATVALAVASLALMAYIIFAYRKVPNAFRYGLCAVIAIVHDILVTVGLFAIAGLVLGWEADALFLTALLTVVGFSVHDTIVVFDRIRENIPKRRGEPFETIVNRSLLETIHRSLTTQLNAVFVLIAVLFFGGATIQQFVAVLVVGLLSGTYSSIFNAVPMLAVFETGRLIGTPRKPKAQPSHA